MITGNFSSSRRKIQVQQIARVRHSKSTCKVGAGFRQAVRPLLSQNIDALDLFHFLVFALHKTMVRAEIRVLEANDTFKKLYVTGDTSFVAF